MYVSRRACQGRRRRETTVPNCWRGLPDYVINNIKIGRKPTLPSGLVAAGFPPRPLIGWGVYICLYLGCLSKANLCYFRSRTCVILRPEPVLFYVPYLCYFRSRSLVSRELIGMHLHEGEPLLF